MKKYIIFFIIFITPPLYIMAESFVIKKTKTKQSRKKLQEQCCDLSAELLDNSSILIGSLAHMQRKLLVCVREFINGESKSRVASATKEQLIEWNLRIKKIMLDMQKLQEKIQKHNNAIQSA